MLAPLQLAVPAPEQQRNAVAFGVLLQHPQIKLHDVPADDHVRVVLCKPRIELLEQLGTAVNVDKIKIERGGIAICRAEHIDNTLAAALNANAVQLAVAGGFNIHRRPFQRRAIVRVRLEAGIDQAIAQRCTVHPDRGGNKALHQKAFRGANIGFIQGHACFAQQFFITHQLAMGAAVKTVDRTTLEIFQFKGRQAPAAFIAQQLSGLFDVWLRDKGNGLLRRQGDVQRAIVSRQPEFHFGTLWGIPPVSGQ